MVDFTVDPGESRRIIRDTVREAEGYWECRRQVGRQFEALRRSRNLGPLTAGIVDEAREKCERDLFSLFRVVAYPADAVMRSVETFERTDLQMAEAAHAAEGNADV